MPSDASVSNAFQIFLTQTPGQGEAFMDYAEKLAAASNLDPKTSELAYIAVLAALRMDSGIPFHVAQARAAGATREEVLSAVLVGLPAAGLGVTQSLPAAIKALEQRPPGA